MPCCCRQDDAPDAKGRFMQSKILFYVAIGGALGAVLRFLLSQWMNGQDIPWGTLSVNLVGSLMLGALMGVAANSDSISNELVMFLGVGILGAFTTLSTYSFETVDLWRKGQVSGALLYASATAVLGPVLAFLGWYATHKPVA